MKTATLKTLTACTLTALLAFANTACSEQSAPEAAHASAPSAQATITANADNPYRFFRQTADNYHSAVPYGNNPSVGKTVQSGSAKIYYEIYGKGEPIVILHGGMNGSLPEMAELLDKLVPNYQIIAVSTRGTGRSELGTETPTFSQKAQDVNAILKQEGIAKTNLIGFSDGAYTAHEFAIAYPDKVNKFVSIGAGDWIKGLYDDDFARPFSDFYNGDPEFWEQQRKVRADKTSLEDWYKVQMDVYKNVHVDAKNTFSKVKVRTLVLTGEDDNLQGTINAYQAMSNADFAVIPSGSHPVFLDNFPAVWASIEPFLNEK